MQRHLSGPSHRRTRLRQASDLGYEVRDEYKRHPESNPSPRRFPTEIPRGQRRGGGSVHDRATARAGRGGLCGPEREDHRGPHRLRHARGCGKCRSCSGCPRCRSSPCAIPSRRATIMWTGPRTACARPSPQALGKPDWRRGAPGIPGGRDVAKEVIETVLRRPAAAPEKFNGCAAYADFRELLDKEKDVDAVRS